MAEKNVRRAEASENAASTRLRLQSRIVESERSLQKDCFHGQVRCSANPVVFEECLSERAGCMLVVESEDLMHGKRQRACKRR